MKFNSAIAKRLVDGVEMLKRVSDSDEEFIGCEEMGKIVASLAVEWKNRNNITLDKIMSAKQEVIKWWDDKFKLGFVTHPKENAYTIITATLSAMEELCKDDVKAA